MTTRDTLLGSTSVPKEYRDDPDRIVSADDAAKILGVHPHTLLRMCQSPDAGGLPWVKISAQRIGYRLGDIRSFIAARRVGTLHAA